MRNQVVVNYPVWWVLKTELRSSGLLWFPAFTLGSSQFRVIPALRGSDALSLRVPTPMFTYS